MSTSTYFPGRLAIQQRVLTPYRAAFFETLAPDCGSGLEVCAGLPRAGESIAVTDELHKANYTYTPNLHILGGPLYFCYQRGLVDWLARGNPAALILEANPRYLASPAAVAWMKRRGRPVLGWGLGSPPTSNPLALARRRSFIHRFNALITYSSRGAEEYAALDFPRERIFVAPNAAAARPVLPMPVRSDAFAGRPSLLFVGRLQKRKRVDLLLRTCAALPEELKPRLIIVGDGPERAGLESLAKEVYPLAEFPGARHGEELAKYFTVADLFVLPGTGGLAVQEAMSYGLPVIMGVGDGTNADLVRPANGWQVRSDDETALLLALQSALSDPAGLRRMGAESYRIVSQEINLERMVEVFVDALNRLSG